MERNHSSIKKLPDVPGVYLFKKGREFLYVGKATSLRDRVRSYFDDDLITTRGPRIVDMVTKADRVAFETAPTVLEALVREAALIKKYQPKANVEGKDDSTFLYVVVTREPIPRVLTVRGKDLKQRKTQGNTSLRGVTLRQTPYGPVRAVYGPFPSGAQLREALRLIRRIFPFFDSPKPINFDQNEPANKHIGARIEFNRQIGQSPRLKSTADVAAYRRSVRHVIQLLAGRGKTLRKTLERDMQKAAKEERFEDAAELRGRLFALNHLQDVSLVKDENFGPQGNTSQRGVTLRASRIEAYDVAHLRGTNAIGVMVVVENGAPVKRDYRTFRIRGQKNSDVTRPNKNKFGRNTSELRDDDIMSLKEILSRRLNHPEWLLPNVIVVDGGRAQKRAAEAVLAEAGVAIPIIAVVKDEKHRPREILGVRTAQVSESDIILANAEAHRFAISRHRRARSIR